MKFELDDDQRMLKETAERLVLQDYGFEDRQKYVLCARGFSEKMWDTFAELGFLALNIPEERGGLGKGPIETMVVMEAFGRALVVEPLLSSAIAGTFAVAHCGRCAMARTLLGEMQTGTKTVTLATAERHSGYDLFDVEAVAATSANGYRLTGDKQLVLHGASADYLVVSARLYGDRRDSEGIGLFLVDTTKTGVTRRFFRLQDGSPAANVSLQAVYVDENAMLSGPKEGHAALASVEAVTIAALCGEAVGIMAEMLDLTLDYISTRQQFGVAIGSFQSLQHRAAEMFIMLEQARSMAMLAAVSCKDSNTPVRDCAVSAAKVQIGKSGRFIGQNAVQLHGGIGMAMEFRIGHLFKRMTVIEILFGDVDHHLDRLAVLGGLQDL
jgi:alkylation response protein AidB-like acyl-CoA dehydrogenase